MKLSTAPSLRYALIAPLALLIGGYFGSGVKHPLPEFPKQETSFNFDSDLWLLGSVGLKTAVADLVWMRTLIESDIEHYRGKPLDSWLYHRFDLISRLDPHFYENYLVGGEYLMIIKDDLEGAATILKRGLERYPDDVQLNWQLGFLYAYEKQDSETAYQYFKKISENPNRPRMFDSIFTRLSAEALGAREAFAFAYESWRAQPEDSELRKKLGLVLYSLKAEIDLACLNKNESGCQLTDFEGKPYLKEKGVWTASKPLVKTRLHRR